MLVSVIFTLLCILSLAMSQDKPRIKCYECINLKDNSCGRTFTGNDNYLIECSENATACQKLEYEDSFQGRHTGGLVVSRSCWESSSAEQYVPDTEKCEDIDRTDESESRKNPIPVQNMRGVARVSKATTHVTSANFVLDTS
ncbi:hypothetical protein MAR_020704, partial [Mya arenaria]